MTDALVIGSGPNGLAAALTLARAGARVTVLEAENEIGGGTRTGQPFGEGILVDHCAAFHPMAVGSPALAGLDAYGLRWAWPEIDAAHPLDDAAPALLHRSVTATAAGLGADARRWKLLFGGPSRAYGRLAADILGPVVHLPRHPLLLGRFGTPTVLPAALLARLFRTEQARALFLGTTAHAMRPLTEVVSAAIGTGILTAGHHAGWPVVVGGTQALTEALAKALLDHGGRIETGVRVTSLDQLPPAAAVLLNLSPTAALDLYGDRLPAGTRRAYRRHRYGPAAFKIDFAVEQGVPWRDADVGRAGTVHLAGGPAEIIANERAVADGRMPERPFVLLGQQYLADPSRSRGDVHPVYSYAHVPAGYAGDATEAITAQIERFAPGFRERIVGVHVTAPGRFASGNANYVGGDILTGAKSPGALLLGPRPGRNPYRTGARGVYLCSAAAPPGPGAHGMAGYHAARLAIRDLGLGAPSQRGGA
ncbi:phytoene desaturase family protein [Nocardioides nitrophenolicus]|uniref:phytoene desaturase family protein n=1 Tax=Nocardioides nitrophenolicus TaxID=60489 RepID=UPI0019593255|nr:NAD(P)/FAD-dependent oxidoreductase [Nocardioides nitrophenolicus]MBM7515590.1 phytoene dehydrogenase-like protein [Nocardioides nitrophenolicus]